VLDSDQNRGNLAGIHSEIHRDDSFREYEKSRVSNFVSEPSCYKSTNFTVVPSTKGHALTFGIGV
jgi:hypothetical protein